MSQERITKSEALRKAIIIVDALKRACSRGNAGLEAERGMEESFWMDTEIAERLREILRDMEATEKANAKKVEYNRVLRDWQTELMDNGLPERMTL